MTKKSEMEDKTREYSNNKETEKINMNKMSKNYGSNLETRPKRTQDTRRSLKDN